MLPVGSVQILGSANAVSYYRTVASCSQERLLRYDRAIGERCDRLERKVCTALTMVDERTTASSDGVLT